MVIFWSFLTKLTFASAHKIQKWLKMTKNPLCDFLSFFCHFWILCADTKTNFAKMIKFLVSKWRQNFVIWKFCPKWLGSFLVKKWPSKGFFNRQPRLARLRGAPGSAGLRNARIGFPSQPSHRELKLANHEFICFPTDKPRKRTNKGQMDLMGLWALYRSFKDPLMA